MAQTTEKSGLVENFKEWACSFSGCDGGDLVSPVWTATFYSKSLEKRSRRLRGREFEHRKEGRVVSGMQGAIEFLI